MVVDINQFALFKKKKKRKGEKKPEWNRSLLISVAVTNNIYVRLILEESRARRWTKSLSKDEGSEVHAKPFKKI